MSLLRLLGRSLLLRLTLKESLDITLSEGSKVTKLEQWEQETDQGSRE